MPHLLSFGKPAALSKSGVCSSVNEKGIGLETVRALAGAGARVTVPARRVEAAEAALANVPGEIEIAAMDLEDLASVRKFTSDFEDTGRALDILINNAGIMACPESRVGPGWERQLGVDASPGRSTVRSIHYTW